MGIVRLVDIDDIIGRIREEGRGRLLVQVSAVDDKDGLWIAGICKRLRATL